MTAVLQRNLHPLHEKSMPVVRARHISIKRQVAFGGSICRAAYASRVACSTRTGSSTVNSHNQFQLLRQRRFAPFFLTQFLGAFNDNVYKNALVTLLAFQVTQTAAAGSSTLIILSGALFILPFFLFSATAGQLADKYEKSR